MRVIFELIDKLEKKGIILSTDGNKISISSPKNILSSELIEEIRNHKDDLIKILASAGKEHAPEQVERIAGKNYPCSFTQQAHFLRYCFSSYWVPQNLCLIFKLTEFDQERYYRFLDKLMLRHEAFKTVYNFDKKKVTQKLQTIDHNQVTTYHYCKDAEVEQLSDQLYIQELNKIIPIEKGPLFHINIIKTPLNSWTLMLTVDMSIIEGSSQNILNYEIPILYEEAAHNTATSLPPVISQYLDFADYEKKIISGLEGNRMKTFWGNYFQESPPSSLLLDTDFPYEHQKNLNKSYLPSLEEELINYGSPNALSHLIEIAGKRSSFRFYPGAMIKHHIEQDELSLIRQTVSRLNVSMNSFFLATYYLLFFQLSGENTLYIGNCISLRNHENLTNTIGFFTNMMFTRMKIDISTPFEIFVREVAWEFLKCYEYRNYPWEKVLEENDIAFRQLSHMFLDYVNLSHRSYTDKPLTQDEHINGVPCIFENNCILNEYDDVLILHWIYSTELFSKNTFIDIVHRHRTIISNTIHNPEATLGSLITSDQNLLQNI